MVLRGTKGVKLTHAEVDANFTELQTGVDDNTTAIAGLGGGAEEIASTIFYDANYTNLPTYTYFDDLLTISGFDNTKWNMLKFNIGFHSDAKSGLGCADSKIVMIPPMAIDGGTTSFVVETSDYDQTYNTWVAAEVKFYFTDANTVSASMRLTSVQVAQDINYISLGGIVVEIIDAVNFVNIDIPV